MKCILVAILTLLCLPAFSQTCPLLFAKSNKSQVKARIKKNVKVPNEFFAYGEPDDAITYLYKEGEGEFTREILYGEKNRAVLRGNRGLDTNLSTYRSYSVPREDSEFETLAFDIERKLRPNQQLFSAMIDGYFDPTAARGPTLNQFLKRAKDLGFKPRRSQYDGQQEAEATKDGILINWSVYEGRVMIGVIHEHPISDFKEVIEEIVPKLVKYFNYIYPEKAISHDLVALSIEVAKRSNEAPLKRKP